MVTGRLGLDPGLFFYGKMDNSYATRAREFGGYVTKSELRKFRLSYHSAESIQNKDGKSAQQLSTIVEFKKMSQGQIDVIGSH